ncbi:metal-dependent hydrolase [Erythrobacter sp.]|jgi:inner membrane protein|uniref:metal-dependent hydrolase n=1 Tax=Erythrobacter sp. TaxID=1042 RepID=UPI002EB56656|nr:metal-dependent hydrolase [Erythrobacter sp.]
MDNLTHGLVGAVIGQTGLKRKTGLGMPALVIGANLPDVDAACFFWLEGTEHLGFRRGITHGPPAMVLLPLILAGLLWGFDRWQARRGKRPETRAPVRFGWLYALAFVGCLSHPALDWLNVYGIRLLEPFSSRWFYGDTLFIIDVWLWALLIVSVLSASRREKAGGDQRGIARAALAIMLAYIGVNGAQTASHYAHRGDHWHPQAVSFIASPAPIRSWERERIAQLEDGRWVSDAWGGEAAGEGYRASEDVQCALPDLADERQRSSQVEAFLSWSRAPFATRAEDGSIVLRDARFYDPRARGRFGVALRHVQCAELPSQ